ncbi:MAG: HAD hydrolase-like protein [Nanoarchaeota archaeon]|nr:HAD hydrolase-like protein [Nanoarchaeota archaeon]
MMLFFDVDGTLFDISRRFYFVYKKIVTGFGYKCLDYDEYWSLRKNNRTTKDIFLMSGTEELLQAYYEQRRQEFERLYTIIKCDRLIVHPSLLSDLKKKKHKLVIVSARDNKENLLRELEFNKIDMYFDTVLTTPMFSTAKDKVNAITLNFKDLSNKDIIIGDSESDILAGKALKIKTIAVLSGIRNKDTLAELEPDMIVHTVNNIREVIL